jgi:hypothetical protein
MKRYFIPERKADFYNWQNILVAYLLPRHTGWRIPDDRMNELTDQKADYTKKYETALDPLTRTPGATLARQQAHKSYEAALRRFIKEFLTFNSGVTDEDRRNMGLPVRDTHLTPHPAPHHWPKISVRTTGERHITVTAKDPDTDLKKKPADAAGIRYACQVCDTQPRDQSELHRIAVSRKVEHTFTFAEAERGKKAFFACCYENGKSQPGPWSNIIETIVP